MTGRLTAPSGEASTTLSQSALGGDAIRKVSCAQVVTWAIRSGKTGAGRRAQDQRPSALSITRPRRMQTEVISCARSGVSPCHANAYSNDTQEGPYGRFATKGKHGVRPGSPKT